MGGVYEYKEFYAIQNKTGSNRALRVGGKVAFRSGDWKARLERDDGPPIPISPLSPKFVLVLTPPREHTKQIDEVTLEEYREENPPHEYYEVVFSVRNEDGSLTDDEPPPSLLVEHPNGPSPGQPPGG